MLDSEKLAIAAHLHVLLRRKAGRVTDLEWMARNTEYATEIVRFASEHAKTEGHPDIAEWADKLAAAMRLDGAGNTPLGSVSKQGNINAISTPSTSDVASPSQSSEPSRYVMGIR